MAKDPAFLFYSSDFLTGTMTMTNEQVGKYIRLLCLQHQKGFLCETDMNFICGSYDKQIFDKFEKVDEHYFNKRLKIEAEKRANFCKSRSENRDGKKNLKPKKTRKSYVKHMENKNEDEIKNVIDYEELRLLYNNNRDKLSECIALNDQRKGFINERVKEHGIEKVKEVILSACKSDFLNGKNDKNWKADFEWIVRPTNFLKILEGRFINSVETTQQKTNSQFFPR